MAFHTIPPIAPPNGPDFSRVVSHQYGRHFGADPLLEDPHRNPILDRECSWWDNGCKKRKEFAQQRAHMMAAVESSYQPPLEDTGPGIGTYAAMAAIFVGGMAVLTLL